MKRRAFSLIEMLVVMAIIATLIAVLVPAVQKVREAAARIWCQNNLKQMALACHGYHDANGHFPPGGDLRYLASWMVHVLPYLEQQNVYDSLWPLFQAGDFAVGTIPANDAGQPIGVYVCPADPRGAQVDRGDYWSGRRNSGNARPVFMTDYVGIAGIDVGIAIYGTVAQNCNVGAGGNTAWPPPAEQLGIFNNTFVNAAGISFGGSNVGNPAAAGATVAVAQVSDGTSNTLLIGERPFVTPGASGGYATRACTPTAWSGFGAYFVCEPDFSVPMGYYIYSGQLSRDTVTGVNNTTTVLSANLANSACSAGPYLYGRGPNDVNNACSFNYVWSNHGGGANFALADGSVHYVCYAVGTATLNAASTYAGGEVLGSDEDRWR